VSRLGDRGRRSFLYVLSFLYELLSFLYGFWSFLYEFWSFLYEFREADVLGYATDIDGLRPRLRRSRFQAPSRKTGACLTS
jgi:hypothetical protein